MCLEVTIARATFVRSAILSAAIATFYCTFIRHLIDVERGYSDHKCLICVFIQ